MVDSTATTARPRFAMVTSLRFLWPALPLCVLFDRWWNSALGRAVIFVLVGLSLFNVWAQTIAGQPAEQ